MFSEVLQQSDRGISGLPILNEKIKLKAVSFT